MGGVTAVTGTFFLGPYQGGTTTPLMMIPSGNPKEVLDLPAVPMTPAKGLQSEPDETSYKDIAPIFRQGRGTLP